MGHLVARTVALAHAHAWVAYGVALLLAAGESFPVFGALIPGTAAIVALGALVPGGALGLWPLIVATTAGAVLGDGFSYWLGHRYKGGVATVWPLRGRPDLIRQGNEFFARHGGKAILAARFTPGVRAIVPLVAGIAGMPVVRFYAVNVLSAALWGPSHVVMGVVIGASLTVLGAIAGRLAALVFVVFLLLAFLVWVTPRAIRWLNRTAIRLHDPVHDWAASRDTWFRRQILSLLDPARPELGGLVTLGALLVAAVWVLAGVLQDVLSGDPLVRADQAVFQLLQSLRVVAFDRVAVAITELGDAVVIVAVALVVLIWLAWHRAWRAAIYGAAAVAGGAAFAVLLTWTLKSAGPWPSHTGPGTLLVSGHTTVNAVLYGFLALLIGREVGLRWRIGVALAAMLLICSIAFSRLYLGAQLLSDVIVGLAFGLAWIALLGIAYLQHTPQRIRAGGLASIAAIVLLSSGAAHIWLSHQADMRRYAMQEPIQTMALAGWRQGGWTKLPVRRIDLGGEYEEPFIIQWAGSLDELRSKLVASGWVIPVPWTLRSSLEWLSPQVSPAALPVLPRLAEGHSEDLVMIRTGGAVSEGQRLVLRMWRSDVSLSADSKAVPLWIGTAVNERIEPVASLLVVTREHPDMILPLRLLHEALPSARVERRQDIVGDPHWNGFVLLGR